MNVRDSPIFSYHFVPGHSPFIDQTDRVKFIKTMSPVACVPDVDNDLNVDNKTKIFRKHIK